MLVIDQEAGEDKKLRLVQMTPRLTANRGLLSRPPAALLRRPARRAQRRASVLASSLLTTEGWAGGGKISAVTAVPFAGGPAGKVVVAGTSRGRVFSWMPFV